MNCLTTLYDYQRRAVDKLIRSRVCALFMEMGTGKTRTAIEFVALRRQRIDRVVWFCPVSLKETIAHEILAHTDTTGREIYIFDDKTGRCRLPKAFWYIVGIESMSSSNRVVLAANKLITTNTFVIVDESEYIKGHRAARTRRITTLSERARYRMILTGTPLSQGVVDLFTQMRFLSPKILGYNSFYMFAREHLVYSDKFPGKIVKSLRTDYLAARIAPYVYQVTKDECLDLPPKLYKPIYFRMSPAQRAAYEQAKEEILYDLYDDDISLHTIFRLFTALQQIVSGYWNRRLGRGKKSRREHIDLENSRLGALRSAVRSIPPGEKVIVWCKYQYSVHAVVGVLAEIAPVAEFHGRLGEKERNREIERFRGEARFLVATQAAGGHGLTLNEARYVIFYENGFKYSERIQSEDRCHRIGQTAPVTYIDLVCLDSIDQRIQSALAKKGDTVRDFKRQVDRVKDKSKKDAWKILKAL